MSNLTTKELLEEVESLPSEERAFIADSILKTLNRVDENIDNEWLKVAEERLNDLKSGKVKSVSSEEVLTKVRERFSK